MAVDPAATWEATDSLEPWGKNPRVNDGVPVDAVARSLKRFGFASPIIVQSSTRQIIAGHTRWKAAKSLGLAEVPVRFMDLEEGEALALALADNKLGELADWDDELLESVIRDLDADGVDLDDLGWSDDELAAMLEIDFGEAEDPEDEAPEVRPDAVSEVGEVYELGPHRVMCGDSTDAMDVATLMGGEVAVLYHSDPPYGMGKEGEGVANDNLYRDKLDAFLTSAWRTWRKHLADNASVYVWGNAEDLWRWWYGSLQPFEGVMSDGVRLALRNEIVWDKGSGQNMNTDTGRSYAPSTERCLFAMRGQQEFGSVNKDDYWEGWEPIRAYLSGEVQRMEWGPKDIKRICGVGMYSHWFSKSQWTMIPEKHYAALAAAADGQAFTRPYASLWEAYGPLEKEFQGKRDEFNEGRAFFDNTHDTMRDVWEFPRVKGADREGHATPKPVAMMQRIVRSSCPEGALVVEPFGGSGSTLMGCVAAGRVCYTMELLPQWVDVIRRRWTKYAKENGVDPGPGALE